MYRRINKRYIYSTQQVLDVFNMLYRYWLNKAKISLKLLKSLRFCFNWHPAFVVLLSTFVIDDRIPLGIVFFLNDSTQTHR